MKKGKKILAVLITLALIAGVVGGIIYAVRESSRRTITVYKASELNYGGYMYDAGSTMEGYVTANAAQNVYAANELVVREILVREGQEVVVGDVLLTYDTEKSQLNLEKAELARQQLQLQLDVAMRNLTTLGKLNPVAETSESEEEIEEIIDDGVEEEPWEVVEIDDEEEEPPYKDAVCYDKLTSDSLAYNLEDEVEFTKADIDPELLAGMTDEEAEAYIAEMLSQAQLGTEQSPYRFLCRNGAVIEPSFINHMKKMAEERNGSYYIQLEVREGDTVDGRLIEAWLMDAFGFVSVGKDWSARVLVDEYIATPTPTPGPKVSVTPSVTVTVTVTPTGTATPSAGISPTVTVTPTDSSETVTPAEDQSDSVTPTGETPTPADTDSSDESDTATTETPTETVDPTGNVTPEETEPVTEIPEPTQTDGTDSSEPNVTEPAAAGEDTTGSAFVPGFAGALTPDDTTDNNAESAASGFSYATAGITTKYLMTAMATTNEKSADGSQIAAALGLISNDAQMTAEEIKEAKKQEEQTIKSLKLDLREAALKLEAAEKAVEEGTAKAKMNGVVKSVTEPDTAQTSGTPIVQVTAAEGLFVKSALPENLYGSVHVGDIVSIISWTTGQSFSGRIREVAYYPDTSGMFGYGSSTTYYPMTIYISERSEALKDGEWVQVTVTANAASAAETENAMSGSGLNLYKAFIREDSEGKYVLKRGEDEKLVKQYVMTGEMTSDAYEILSGLTEEDWVAFPYGRNLTEGLETREGTVDELYAS